MTITNTGRIWTGSNTGLIPEVMASGDPLRNGDTLVVNGKKRATNHRRNSYSKNKLPGSKSFNISIIY